MFKEDILRLYKTFVSTLNHMYVNEIMHFNPLCPSCFLICHDSHVRFNAIPILVTNTFLTNIKKERLQFAAPETFLPNYVVPNKYVFM
jgi:hypothetical protein